ncbi:MAG: AI-2E family transporter [Oscillospiraceae bacterium]|nr:AI-2E family transporter [Oscillospiraceae bacterium]
MKIRWSKKYLSIAVTSFLVIAASILFALFIFNLGYFWSGAKRIGSILSPVFVGFAIAYLLSPAMIFFEDKVFCRLKFKKPVLRYMSVSVTYMSFLIVAALFLWVVMPRFIGSISDIVSNSNSYLESAQEFVDSTLKTADPDNPLNTIAENLNGYIGKIPSSLVRFADDLSNLYAVVFNVINIVTNFLVGLILSIYLLANKEKFCLWSKKAIYAFIPTNSAKNLIGMTRQIHRTFGHFISARILESLIVGVICYIGMLVFGIPYAMLISVVVGVTNVIPFVGPFIGAIPSGILILLESPVKALIFGVFILILQQIDGNYIGPKLMGRSVGLPAFWVIVAILLGGGLFGVLGMFVAVPVFAVMLGLLNSFVKKSLDKKIAEDSGEIYNDIHTSPQRAKGSASRVINAVKRRGHH